MERDFMGLNSRDSELEVKEEGLVADGKYSGYSRSTGRPWPSSNKNFGSSPIKQQFCSENPPTSHHPILTSAVPIAATTEQWLKSKTSNSPAQLTIFYAGTVNVFDDISPEKAQAIMLLAGSGGIPNQVHMPTPKSPGAILELVNQPMNMSVGSGLPSPISVSSHPIDQSGGAAAKNKDDKVAIMIGMPNTLVNKVEPPRIVSSIGSSALTAMISSAIPQSRKASLARFLQKRNERASTAAPYNPVKKEANGSTTPEAGGFEFSDSSGVASSFRSPTSKIIGNI
ncbi:protein TIFY 6b-like isoform X2 [Henckelia pumila]|uniref:protein TIFY 6b-like isoform X2 n=1 Tax=Henckelia pumila TaxID=405737 RepID=UPI003C6DDBB7